MLTADRYGNQYNRVCGHGIQADKAAALLYGIRADKVVVSGIQPLAESDFKWAGCVTMSERLVRE